MYPDALCCYSYGPTLWSYLPTISSYSMIPYGDTRMALHYGPICEFGSSCTQSWSSQARFSAGVYA
eukprot:321793-Rhodomonas_salina.1